MGTLLKMTPKREESRVLSDRLRKKVRKKGGDSTVL
jgi:hypothetical protein